MNGPDLTALQGLGERLRAAGSTSAAPASPKPYTADLIAAGLTRLRAVVGGETLPEESLTEAQLAAYVARYKPENARRALGGSSGWHELPQCSGCRAILKHHGAQCTACGFMDGGGYLGVPAKTSYLERWR